MTATAIEQLGTFLARCDAEQAAGDIVDKLDLHVTDIIAAWIAGSRTAEGQALIGFSARSRPEGQGEDRRASLFDDVATNCALTRLSEVDDIHLASMTTPGSIVIPGALAIARALPNVPAADLVAAILAGYEAMIRLGTAINGPHVLYRGIWPTYFATPFGMAAVAARLLHLSAQETSHALALALTLASPSVGHHNAPTTARWLAVGNAARNGLGAALAAQSGFTSDLKMMESGFLTNVYGITGNAAAFTEALGAKWTLSEVSFKPWCAARQTMAATQALREVLEQGIRADDIIEIHAAVLPPHLKMIAHGIVPGDRASHLTSLPYQMALAAFAPEQALDVAQSPKDVAAPVRAFMERIKVAGDEGLIENYPAAWPARIAVETRAGISEHRVTYLPGDPARPLSPEQLADKFHKLVAPAIGAAQTAKLVQQTAAWRQPGRSAPLVDEVDRICRGISLIAEIPADP